MYSIFLTSNTVNGAHAENRQSSQKFHDAFFFNSLIQNLTFTQHSLFRKLESFVFTKTFYICHTS